MRGFFRQVEIAEQPNQRRQHAARVGSIDLVDPLAHALVGHRVVTDW
jgi:hypothetical protein